MVSFLICALSVSFFLYLSHISLPSEQTPILFYANQKGDDLKKVFLKSLSTTKHSLFLQIYGCTDPTIICSLQALQKKGLSTSIFYDPSGSGALYKSLSGAIALPRYGLMHKKILLLDEEIAFLGSANLTPTSLCMHDNIVIGIYSKDLVYDILHSPAHQTCYQIGEQRVTLWHLPDHKHACLKNIVSLLNKAEKKIQIALFTFTHPIILQSLKLAKQKGVDVQVALDYSSSQGSSAKTVRFLQEAKIPIHLGPKGKLLHHKWCLIDEKTFLVGSANWTQSAFRINEDCLLIIEELTKEQLLQMRTIWKKILLSSQHQKP